MFKILWNIKYIYKIWFFILIKYIVLYVLDLVLEFFVFDFEGIL